MAKSYRTKAGDMLDQICVDYYGIDGLNETISAVLEANPGLAAVGPVYDAGQVIYLPDITISPVDTGEVTLWS